MSQVVLNIPRKLHRVEIIRSKDVDVGKILNFVPKEFQKEEKATTAPKEEKVKKVPEDAVPEKTQEEEPKTVFIQEFKVTNTNQPVKISLEKIPDEKIPLEEVQKEVQEAYDRGFADGQELTIYTFKNEIASHQQWVKNIDSVVIELQNHYVREIANMEEVVVELSVMAAEHILEHEISENSQIVIEQTRKAIQSLDKDIIFKIRLHPDNIEALKEAKSSLSTDASRMKSVEISADESVDRGSCILETSAGTIDARLSTQFDKMRLSLKALARNSQPQSQPAVIENPETEDDNA
jgi:flagellar assembly protein FliH